MNYHTLLFWLSLLLCAVIVTSGGRATFAQSPAGGSVSIVSAANFGPSLAPDTIAAAFADGDLTTQTQSALDSPLPLELAGVRVWLAGQFCGLFYVSPRQVNFHIPAGTPLGLLPVQVFTPQGQTFNGSVYIAENAPSLFTFSGDGQGDAAAIYFDFGIIYVALYGTGCGTLVGVPHGQGGTITTGSVTLRIGGKTYPALYCGPARPFFGLQQLNFAVPASELAQPAGASVRVCNPSGACWTSNGVTLRRR